MKGIYVCERSQPSAHPDGRRARSGIEPARRRPPSGRVTRVTPWIVRFEQAGAPDDRRPRVAVKDAIDLAGVPTTAGCVAVRDRATPAAADAACLAGFRTAGVSIVGKTTLTELCLSPTGVNEAFGMPRQPAGPRSDPGRLVQRQRGGGRQRRGRSRAGHRHRRLGAHPGGLLRPGRAQDHAGAGSRCAGSGRSHPPWTRSVRSPGTWPVWSTGSACSTRPGPGRPGRPPRSAGCASRAPTRRWRTPSTRPWRPPGSPSTVSAFEGGRPQTTRSPRSSWASCGGAITTWSTPPVSVVGRTRHCTAAGLSATGSSPRPWPPGPAGRPSSPRRCGPPPSWRCPRCRGRRRARDASRGFPITSLTAPFNLAGVPAIALPVPSSAVRRPAEPAAGRADGRRGRPLRHRPGRGAGGGRYWAATAAGWSGCRSSSAISCTRARVMPVRCSTASGCSVDSSSTVGR